MNPKYVTPLEIALLFTVTKYTYSCDRKHDCQCHASLIVTAFQATFGVIIQTSKIIINLSSISGR